ncbi:MAG TPA: hypothetical protein PK020_00160 [Ilumatobacteraceae bacterium]|nr:hypothetical protein [Ilumatobacteraceae bacterium]HRB01760.1 hypothetical protein [Ilumatobacteraceae bacterium]
MDDRPTSSHPLSDVTRRWRAASPLLVAGGVSIVAGGLVAAITGPTDWDRGSWVAAFLVLVAGVAQIGVGASQAHLSPAPTALRFTAVQCALWNVACVATIVGSLLNNTVVVGIASAPLVAALVMSVIATKGSGSSRPQLLLAYRMLLILLLASIPVGITLSALRS